MKILLVSATPFEIQPTVDWLDQNFDSPAKEQYAQSEVKIDVLYSGVGLPITAFSLGNILAGRGYDLAIQAGIGGSLDPELDIGEVTQIVSERFGDLGGETAEGSFMDLQELGLLDRRSGIFTATGQMLNLGAKDTPLSLKKCNGISVNKVNGQADNILALRRRYPAAQVESMEGAAFFYACLHHKLSFLQLRSISNYVEARDRDKWNIPLAIERLNEVTIGILGAFVQPEA